jgi:hypothetical protein
MMLSRSSASSSRSSQVASLARILISRMAVMGKPSFSFSILIFFTATSSPLALCRARYTSP